jgi:hypothetical protein
MSSFLMNFMSDTELQDLDWAADPELDVNLIKKSYIKCAAPVVAPVVHLTPSAAGPLRRHPLLLVVGYSGISRTGTNHIPAFHQSL